MPALERRDFLKTALVGLAATGSTNILAADKDAALKIMLFGGDLPAVRDDLDKGFDVEFVQAGVVADKKEDNVAGLEQLAKCDLWIGSISKRILPGEEQLKHFQDYLASGKPIVGYRAASHVFQNWLQIDREVFGVKYGVHHLQGKDEQLEIKLAEGAAKHEILKGLEAPPPRSGSYVYTEVQPEVQLLLYSGLPGDMMPHTWVREIPKTKNRVFYTRYDASDFAKNPVCREILLRGVAWALGGELEKRKKPA